MSRRRRRRRRSGPGWALGASLALGGLACSSPPQGELVLVLTTDMAIPKDIDAVAVEILGDGERQYRGEYDVASGNLKLPGTVGILSRAADQEITVRVTASSGERVRLERTVVTKMPADRVAMLEAPLEWLCTDRARPCDEGQTCDAGRCMFSRVASISLPTYSEGEVFGGGDSAGDGGECFDAKGCFTGAFEVPPPDADGPCTVSAPGDARITNVALRTEVDGICGPAGCLVPLDHGGAGDWTSEPGAGETRITLPPGVCKEERRARVFGVVLSTRCDPKTPRRPTCGPWSPVGGGGGASPEVPVTLAGDQHHPRSLAAADGSVFWTSAGGTGALRNGTVKSVSRDGGALKTLASTQGSPSGLVLDLSATTQRTVWWIDDEDGRVTKVPAAGGAAVPVVQWPGARVGIAADDGCIYFTTSVGQVICIAKDDSGQRPVAEHAGDPTQVTADGENVYWIERGDSRVTWAPRGGGGARSMSPAQASPVALVADAEGVYWVNAGTAAGDYNDGAVIRLRRDGGAPETMRAEQKLPSAIAIDETSVYWTNKGDGTVMKMPKKGDGGPRALASGQKNPIAIVVDDRYVYWANAGTAGRQYTDGAILRVAKQ